MSISFFKKYPFTKEAIDHLKNLEIDIFSLSEQHPDVLNAAVENIEMLFDRGEYNEKELNLSITTFYVINLQMLYLKGPPNSCLRKISI